MVFFKSKNFEIYNNYIYGTLTFPSIFLVLNWNILDKSKFFSYTLKGEEFDGKVHFCKKNFFPFLLVGYPQKTGCSAKNITEILFVGKKTLPLNFPPFKV